MTAPDPRSQPRAFLEHLYREVRAEAHEKLLPLVSDLTTPSPAIGWANAERTTIEQRGPVDTILALDETFHSGPRKSLAKAYMIQAFPHMA